MGQEKAPQCRAAWQQFLTEIIVIDVAPDGREERGVSVDGEPVPQPDGRVRQGGGGQAGRGRHGRGLQSDASRSASHYLDCLKSKTCHNILSIINSFVSSNQSSLRYHAPLDRSTPAFCFFTRPNATGSQPDLWVASILSFQLKASHTTHATQCNLRNTSSKSHFFLHVGANSCPKMSSLNLHV